jgi:hypothetical protein
MKFDALVLRVQAAMFVAGVLFAIVGPPPAAKAGSSGSFSVPGCPLMPSIAPIARKIFGSYQWSAAGGVNYQPGQEWRDLLPAGAYVTECVFVRKWDSSQDAAASDSDILFVGYGRLSNSAALMETWNRVKSSYALTSVRQGSYHFAERSGLTVGYRDGLNEIAVAYWTADRQEGYQNVPGSRLRPLITAIISP